MTKTCPICNKSFEADNPTQVYCSYRCRRILAPKRKGRGRPRKSAVKPELSCENCRHSVIHRNSLGESLDYVLHVCLKHHIQVGLYGTCFDFDPHDPESEESIFPL